MSVTQPAPASTELDPERSDILTVLARHRGFLRYTTQGLTDEQAAQRTTVSELTLAGLIKHVATMESQWVDFVLGGPTAMGSDVDWSEGPDEETLGWFATGCRMVGEETLAGRLERMDEIAAGTADELRTLPDPNASQPLPVAPWFEPGASWSARRVFLHLIAEIAQHSGHADVIREALDGQKTMG